MSWFQRLALLLTVFLIKSTTKVQATVLIFYTDSDGITHAEVRHDLDDCGFANVNPSVDCFPWFNVDPGNDNSGAADIINNNFVEPAKAVEGCDYCDVKAPGFDTYDFYFVREECLLRGGKTKLHISKIDAEKSSKDSVTRLAAAAVGCGEKFRVLSVPSSTKEQIFIGTEKDQKFAKFDTMVVTQGKYGEILIDGVIFEVE
uniref:Uncharacterized protein n=1 Tax=Odontella aurita TaxID=265563 RepID=A0A7S4JRQ1_9STRA|mmetsp:Transcript_52327/g.157059  ORF Transcript_52327/g.157059 Transcript_52327/m.157059 type:complete len:202 (+) Transcript_52327:101-706(+)